MRSAPNVAAASNRRHLSPLRTAELLVFHLLALDAAALCEVHESSRERRQGTENQAHQSHGGQLALFLLRRLILAITPLGVVAQVAFETAYLKPKFKLRV